MSDLSGLDVSVDNLDMLMGDIPEAWGAHLDFELGLDALHSASRTTTMELGQRVEFRSEYAGMNLRGYARFDGADLTQMTKIRASYVTEGREGEKYLQASGVLGNVKMDYGVILDGNDVPMDKFCWRLFNSKASDEVSYDSFKTLTRQLGFRWGAGATMLWHHFGVNEPALDEAIAMFCARTGAVNTVDQVKRNREGRMEGIYKAPDGAATIPVDMIEVTAANREISRTNQGFTDFITASLESFTRTLRLKHAATIQERIAADSGLDDEDRRRGAVLARYYNRQAVSWAVNLGGVQRRQRINEAGQLVSIGTEDSPVEEFYDPVNVPIGRMHYDFGTTSGMIDLWSVGAPAPTPTLGEIHPTTVEEFESDTGTDIPATEISGDLSVEDDLDSDDQPY